ncbi:MAG TPA: hypothetical protein VK211_13000 [Kamptonema sp.]|nr:hypothetical protein [Kamptonema sp.]
MTQQNLRELAKQGDPKVIASVINRTLQPKGINAQVARDNDCLQVMLESDQVPSQPALMDFIRKGMMNLGVESIHIVKVYGRQVGEDLPAWEDEIELMPADPMFYADEGEMPKKPVDDADRETENYDREEEYDPDEEVEEEEEELDEAPSQKKNIPKLAIIAGIVFVPLAALAGLFLTGNLPFLNSSAPPPVTPSPVPSKAASPKPKPSASPATAAAPNASKVTSPAPAASASPKAATPAPAASASPKAATPTPVASASPKAATPKPKPATPKPDSWRAWVNKAQNAANLAQTSISKGEWEQVASEWQKAVELMKAVPPSSPNYEKAQQKAAEYQSNLAIAQRRAAAAE